jgi:succinate dehydrogenase/fumarate reductase flavoprotein subunit
MWHNETDVVVIGYGGAGAAAAITVHDAGSNVIILEKSATGGGNTRHAGGTLREYLNIDKAITFFSSVFPKDVSQDRIRTYVEESAKNPQWILDLGGELDPTGTSQALQEQNITRSLVIWSHLPGAEGMGGRWHVKGSLRPGGANMWALLQQSVEKRGIKVLINTRATHLITNEHKEIIGVTAEGPDGEIRLKARRAVVLTCGGFSSNAEMMLNYIGLAYGSCGHPGNTGDGVRMGIEVGADLWHMCGVSCTLGFKVPEYDVIISASIRAPQHIFVDQNGKRFVDEVGTDLHAMAYEVSHQDHKTLTYPRIPAYLIFDESVREAGPIQTHCPGPITDVYKWSKDNLSEIEKGWIKKAKNVRELALQLGLRPESLQEAVSKYNIYCAGGYDAEFGRREESLKPIIKPPFYGIALWPSLINTQGGPKRNAKAQVLNTEGKPIKRLYSAGELGSFFNRLYPGAGNVSEALAFGRIAGRNAATEILLD